MMRFWNTRTSRISGTVAVTQAAVIVPMGLSNGTEPVNVDIATGMVCTAGLRGATVLAIRNSFQEETNTRIDAVKIPGAASGRITQEKAWNGVGPSTWAASSIYKGIEVKQVVRTQHN